MRVEREKFLQELESVQPGLSQKEIVEQSSCFIFKDGKVMTFNDEIFCKRPTCTKLNGAVSAAPLLSLLQKLPNDEIELETTKSSLLVKAKNRKASIRMEKEILLPVETVEIPKTWKPVQEDFAEAIDMASQCASEDASNFAICCIHITPKYLEATDNFQLTRYKLKTGVEKELLVKQSSIKHIVQLGMSEFCETESWLHFKNNQSGLLFSCRRWEEEFPDMGEFLTVEGDAMTMPKALEGSVEKAEIFSSADPDKNEVLVEIRPGVMSIKGLGPDGWYKENKKLHYSGSPHQFYIGPKLLVQVSNKANECIVSSDRLKIDGGKFSYVVCLGTPEDKEENGNGDQPGDE